MIKKLSPEQIKGYRDLQKKGKTPAEIAILAGCSISTAHHFLSFKDENGYKAKLTFEIVEKYRKLNRSDSIKWSQKAIAEILDMNISIINRFINKRTFKGVNDV